jgi:hypothetical protein
MNVIMVLRRRPKGRTRPLTDDGVRRPAELGTIEDGRQNLLLERDGAPIPESDSIPTRD